jgi:squalene-hopene/tetraprenyl-beta-curcumene cyclase
MESRSHLRLMPMDRHEVSPRTATAPSDNETLSGAAVRRAIRRGRQWLLAEQHEDGHWCAELEGDTILESETILLLAFLGEEQSELARRASRYLIEKQLPEGGWAMYPGGAADVSGSVKAYFALKLTGHDPGAEYMQRARNSILAHGGADAVNSFTRFYLALLGQISYDQCPAVPPEVVLSPQWCPANLYAVSSWSRTIIVPLSIVSALEPVRHLEARLGIRELFLREPQDWPTLRCPGLPGGTGLVSWDRVFRTIDSLAHWCQRHGVLPLRRRALRAAEKWMLERFARSDGLGAIYPPIIFSMVALQALGYAPDSPEVRECRRQLEGLVIEDQTSGTVRLQPCKSPVWDTALTLRALQQSGVAPDASKMARGMEWLLDRECTWDGDWSRTVDAPPGGWYFEYANEFYPDCDDTAMVLMALRTGFDALAKTAERSPCAPQRMDRTHAVADTYQRMVLTDRTAGALDRGLRWLLAMQNDDGGWGAFDRNNNRQFLCYVPFADHNAMIDPSTPDITARVLEALGELGRRIGEPVIDRGVEYLRRSQEPDGSWYGRWGVNYIYGTWQTLTGLAAVGLPADDPMMVGGVNWLLSCQQPNGAWGESPDSYADPRLRGQGPATASQTAWAVLGLIAAGQERSPAVVRGIRHLLRTQRDDGTWYESEFTGTGFPRVFYLRYHYYPIYFPLMALSRWATQCGLTTAAPTERLRVVGAPVGI